MKKLIIYDDISERLESLDPGRASGIPIPTAQVMPTKPVAGTVLGEMVHESTTGMSWIWNGSAWRAIQSDFLHLFDDDSIILGTTIPQGHIAISKASGNYFQMVSDAGGNQVWRQWGIREYATVAAMLADVSAAEGSIAVALDEHTAWLKQPTEWLCLGTRQFALQADLFAWAPSDGSEAIELEYGIHYLRASGDWTPESIYVADEATILATTWAKPNQMAAASDTGRMWVYDGTAGNWVGSQIRHYPTDVALQADAPVDGILAWADDTGLVYARNAGAWRRINSPTITAGTAKPATPASGDLFLDTGTNTAEIFDGTNWQQISSPPVDTGNTEPTNPNEGDLWHGGNWDRLQVYARGKWRWATPGGVHAKAFSIANGTQDTVSIPTSQYPERFVRFRGFAYCSGGPAKIGIIGHIKDTGWVNWNTLMKSWGHFMEKPHNGGAEISQGIHSMAETNAGLNLMYNKANGSTAIVFDLRIDIGPSSEPIFTSDVMFTASNVRYHARMMSPMNPGEIGINKPMTSIGLKVMSGSNIASRGQIEWS